LQQSDKGHKEPNGIGSGNLRVKPVKNIFDKNHTTLYVKCYDIRARFVHQVDLT